MRMQELKKKEKEELAAVLGELGIDVNAKEEETKESSEAALKKRKKREAQVERAKQAAVEGRSASQAAAGDGAAAGVAQEQAKEEPEAVRTARHDVCIQLCSAQPATSARAVCFYQSVLQVQAAYDATACRRQRN